MNNIASKGSCDEAAILRQRIAELEGMLEQQTYEMTQQHRVEKIEAMKTIVGGLAHNFNNMLMAITGYTELAKEDLAPEHPTQRYLQEVLAAGVRAKDMVQQLLMASYRARHARTPVPFALVIHCSLKYLQPLLPATIALHDDVPAEVGQAEANPAQIHQIIMQLGMNAVHAMRHNGGVLRVSLAAVSLHKPLSAYGMEVLPGPYIRLSVGDSGEGMGPEVLERMFTPFFTTKDVGEGLGLGMAVVQGLIAEHEGALTVASTPGEGTTIAMYFPRIASSSAIQKASLSRESLPAALFFP